MKKMTDYRIMYAADVTALGPGVRNALAKGYEPFGAVFTSGTNVCQVIVQYDGKPDSDAAADFGQTEHISVA